MQEPIDLTLTSDGILEKYFAGLHSGGGKSHIRGGQTAANQFAVDEPLPKSLVEKLVKTRLAEIR